MPRLSTSTIGVTSYCSGEGRQAEIPVSVSLCVCTNSWQKQKTKGWRPLRGNSQPSPYGMSSAHQSCHCPSPHLPNLPLFFPLEKGRQRSQSQPFDITATSPFSPLWFQNSDSPSPSGPGSDLILFFVCPFQVSDLSSADTVLTAPRRKVTWRLMSRPCTV